MHSSLVSPSNMINRGIFIKNYYFLLQQVDPAEPDNREEESPALGTIRGKCITQLLLLGAINSIQVLKCLLYLAICCMVLGHTFLLLHISVFDVNSAEKILG